MRAQLVVLFIGILLFDRTSIGGSLIVLGSKKFTESIVLTELAKRNLEEAGFNVEHRQGMGGTIILWEALRQGSIAAYPDYTGTIQEEILKRPSAASIGELREQLAKYGVGVTEELGFNNTYALVMTRARANQLGIQKISDLSKHPELRLGLTHEFLGRHDGWGPLGKRLWAVYVGRPGDRPYAGLPGSVQRGNRREGRLYYRRENRRERFGSFGGRPEFLSPV